MSWRVRIVRRARLSTGPGWELLSRRGKKDKEAEARRHVVGVVQVVGSGSEGNSNRGRALELDKDVVQWWHGVRLPHILRQIR